MPVVEPVQPVPVVQPVAHRAAAWVVTPSGRGPGTVTFDDVLAVCLERSAAPAGSPTASAPRADEPTPPFLFDRPVRSLSASTDREARRGRRSSNAHAAYGVQATPACLRQLGLQLPCTEADVRHAYRRLARALHPDAGGDPRTFMALRVAYEEALRFTSANAA